MSSRRKAARAAPYVVVLGIAAFLYYSASTIDFFAPGGRIGPDFWPKMVLLLMIATCIYAIARIALSSSEESVGGVMQTLTESPPGVETAAAEQDEGQTYPLRLALAIGATALYAAVVPVMGFFLTTFVYLTVFMALGRYRRIGVVIGVSLIGTLLMLFFFMRVVYISLPIGTAPFSAVSLFLMQAMGIR